MVSGSVQFLVLFMYFFPLVLSFLCFLVAHWVPLKQLFYSLFTRLQDSLPFSSVVGLLSFGDEMFSCFHVPCSFVLLLEVADISGLYWLPLDGVSSSWSWGSLWPFTYTLAAHFLLPFVEEILSFYDFSGSYNSPYWILEIFFCFPEDGTMAQVYGFSLAYRSWCVFLRALSVITGLALSATLGSTHKELAAEWEVWV